MFIEKKNEFLGLGFDFVFGLNLNGDTFLDDSLNKLKDLVLVFDELDVGSHEIVNQTIGLAPGLVNRVIQELNHIRNVLAYV